MSIYDKIYNHLPQNEQQFIDDVNDLLEKKLTLEMESNDFHFNVALVPAFFTDEFQEIMHISELYLTEGDLNQLPESLSYLQDLKILEIIPELESIPESVRSLHNLDKLNLREVRHLPDWIGELTSLRILIIEGLSNELPESVGNLINLNRLYVDESFLTKIPNSILNLSFLQEIEINNDHFEEIPYLLGLLPQLSEITLPNNPWNDQSRIIIDKYSSNNFGFINKKIKTFKTYCEKQFR